MIRFPAVVIFAITVAPSETSNVGPHIDTVPGTAFSPETLMRSCWLLRTKVPWAVRDDVMRFVTERGYKHGSLLLNEDSMCSLLQSTDYAVQLDIARALSNPTRVRPEDVFETYEFPLIEAAVLPVYDRLFNRMIGACLMSADSVGERFKAKQCQYFHDTIKYNNLAQAIIIKVGIPRLDREKSIELISLMSRKSIEALNDELRGTDLSTPDRRHLRDIYYALGGPGPVSNVLVTVRSRW